MPVRTGSAVALGRRRRSRQSRLVSTGMAKTRSALALVLAVGACVPTRNLIRPPYEVAGHEYGETELQALARDRCSTTYPRAGIPPFAFTTDGCSLWPDGTWRECCLEHDIAYWCGGSSDARRAADRQLRECVRSKAAPANSQFMYYGVRFGGHPLWPFPWRWGYGFSWPFDLCVYDGGDVCPRQPEMAPPFQGR
jgi:hypothetical protein